MAELHQSRWTEDYPALIDEVMKRSTRPHSTDHGVHHWQLVGVTGAHLLGQMDAGDPDVAFLFGLFHDSMRLNDYVDPGHGRRGGELARELVSSLSFADRVDLDSLVEACDHHTSGRVSDDPTIGVCWDSDRLNLWRVAIEPDPAFMSTQPARDPACIAWAEDLQDRSFSWVQVCELYLHLDPREP